jgi:hypothetical protein
MDFESLDPHSRSANNVVQAVGNVINAVSVRKLEYNNVHMLIEISPAYAYNPAMLTNTIYQARSMLNLLLSSCDSNTSLRS